MATKKKVVKKSPAKHKGITLTAPAAKNWYNHLVAMQGDLFGAGTGNSEKLKFIARQMYQKKRSKDQTEAFVKQGNTTTDALVKRAGLTVANEIDPQITQEGLYQSGLKNLYAQVANAQRGYGNAAKTSAATAKSSMAGRYDNLASSIASNFNASKSHSDNELARLGLTGAADTSGRDRLATLQSMAASGKANALTNADARSSSFDNIMALLQGETQASGTNYGAQSAQRVAALKGSRLGKVYTLSQTLRDEARAVAADRAQQNFMNRIASKQFGVKQDAASAQAILDLANARKSIVDSKRPTTVKKKRIG